MATTLERASGRWPELLMALAGLSPEQLNDTHQPCPACGGTDRYRWDRDDGPGGCYCNQCGGKDHAGGGMSGLDLLLRVTGWDLKQAIRRVRSHLDPGGTIDTTPAAAAAPPAKKPKRPARIPDRPPAGTPPPDMGGAVAQWPYFTADDLEQPAFWIQRVDTATGKLFIHRTWLDGRWHYPSKRDAFTSEWPAPRPLYRLPELIARPDAPVLIAEGEKAADAGATLLPDHVVIAWCGGVAGLNHTDWSPLAGRIVILWPDNDDPGRKAMAKLGQRLLGLGCAVSIFNPPDGCPPKWDLANAIAESWATKHIRHLLTKVVKLQPLPEPAPAPESPPPPPPAPPVEISEFSQYFDCLGTDGDGFYYKIHATGHVKRLSAGAHTSTHLVFLAPVAFWESAFPGGRSGANWTAAASRLAQLQASVGFYDESQVRSCGAWWDRGRCVLNLGDRLVVDGIEQSIRKPVPNSRFIYRGGKALRGTDGATPLSDDEAMMIGLIAEQFLWEVKASGPLLAGWVTLAPICGVLDWRPHIWLTASAESGKSTVLNRYIAPLLGSMAVSAYGQSSEAGIRQTLDSKAIAVIFDEAESNEKSDKTRMQNVLTLARIASTESDAQMLKGSPEGKSTGYSIRSMFLLCSIATALKQGADKTRFAQLTLQNPSILGEARHARWKELDEHLDQFITPEIGRRLQARTISLIPMIREATKAFVDATARKFNSRRMGDQYGTLLAGAWSLRYTHAPTPDEASAFLDTIDGWEPYREESTGTPDERSCIEAILQFQVRVEGERSAGLARTVAELIDMTDPVNVSPTDPITSKGAKEHLGRVGLKVQDGRLYIHNNAAGIRRILAETPWSDCWPTVLRRLPDARKEAATNFFGHRGNHRATSVPLTALDQV